MLLVVQWCPSYAHGEMMNSHHCLRGRINVIRQVDSIRSKMAPPSAVGVGQQRMTAWGSADTCSGIPQFVLSPP